MAKEAEEKVMMLIKKKIDPDMSKVTPQTRFEEFGMDSLDRTEFIMVVEDEFKISIPDADAKNMSIIQDLIDYLEEKTTSSAKA